MAFVAADESLSAEVDNGHSFGFFPQFFFIPVFRVHGFIKFNVGYF